MFTRSGITCILKPIHTSCLYLQKTVSKVKLCSLKKWENLCARLAASAVFDRLQPRGGQTDGRTGLMALGQAHRSTAWVVPVTSTTYCSSSSTLLAQLTVRTTSLINSTINLFSKLQLHIPLLF